MFVIMRGALFRMVPAHLAPKQIESVLREPGVKGKRSYKSAGGRRRTTWLPGYVVDFTRAEGDWKRRWPGHLNQRIACPLFRK